MAEPKKPWDILDDEDDLWYDRFEIYRRLGVSRSVKQAYLIAQREDPARLPGHAPGSNWHEKAHKYRWAERARAWDQSERERFRKEEQDINDDKRRTRLQLIDEIRSESFLALKKANLAELDEVQARAALAQLRLLFLGTLNAERAEYGGEGVVEGENQENVITDSLADSIKKAWGNKAEAVAEE